MALTSSGESGLFSKLAIFKGFRTRWRNQKYTEFVVEFVWLLRVGLEPTNLPLTATYLSRKRVCNGFDICAEGLLYVSHHQQLPARTAFASVVPETRGSPIVALSCSPLLSSHAKKSIK
jgi:hypothetical protein